MRNTGRAKIPMIAEDEPLDDWPPEHALLCAIIERALLDLRYRDLASGKHWGRPQQTAKAWLMSPRNKPWTFLWICQHLQLDPQRIRALALEIEAGRDIISYSVYRRLKK